MEQTYCIYKITNQINGKAYIGFTKNFKKRLIDHNRTANKGAGQAIHAAIRKYGWDKFSKEELYYSTDKQHTLDMEDVFIDRHETKGEKGYNVIRGGQQGPPKGRRLTNEQLIRLRERARDPEIRRKISEGLKGNRNAHGGLGQKVSNETKVKQSVAMKGNDNGKYQSVKTRSDKMKKMIGNSLFLGHHHSEQWKQEQSERIKAVRKRQRSEVV